MEVIPKNLESILRGRNFRKGLQMSHRSKKGRRKNFGA